MSNLKIKPKVIGKVVLELEPHEARGLKTLLYRGVSSGVVDELTLGGLLSDLLDIPELATLPTIFKSITALED